ncbi:UNVERIFIED_CONTAM: hypothetical protein GTU68_043714 [Idotea baltica]|nr:hypothetical protein [Idotea baltica]
MDDKEYIRYTGYPGGQRKATPRDLLEKKPIAILENAVRAVHQLALTEPLRILESEERYDIKINVKGGGVKGQAEAVRLGIARALVKENEEVKPTLKASNGAIMTRDARAVERKKPGLRKAHISFEHIALIESKKLGMNTFAMVDTNSDPNLVDFPVPANDDASKSIALITDYLTECIIEGLKEREANKNIEAAKFDEGAENESGEKKTRRRRKKADEDGGGDAPASEEKKEEA